MANLYVQREPVGSGGHSQKTILHLASMGYQLFYQVDTASICTHFCHYVVPMNL